MKSIVKIISFGVALAWISSSTAEEEIANVAVVPAGVTSSTPTDGSGGGMLQPIELDIVNGSTLVEGENRSEHDPVDEGGAMTSLPGEPASGSSH